MMKINTVVLFLAFLGCTLNAKGQKSEPPSEDKDKTAPQVLWETKDQLLTAESVIYDAKREIIYSVNINGDFQSKDGNGFISKISLTGEISNLSWVTGLNAPTGSALFQDILFITDIDEVVKIDVTNGEIIGRIAVPEASNLNDIAITTDGILYVTDTLGNCIFRIDSEERKVLKWSETPTPNGIVFFEKQFYVTSWGQQNYLVLDIEGNVVFKSQNFEGPLDGNAISPNGMHYLACFDGKIFRGRTNDHSPELFIDFSQEGNPKAADVEFIPQMNMLLVATYEGNTIKAFNINNSL